MVKLVDLTYLVTKYSPIQLNILNKEIIKKEDISHLKIDFRLISKEKFADQQFKLINFDAKQALMSSVELNTKHSLNLPLIRLEEGKVGVAICSTDDPLSNIYRIEGKAKYEINDVAYKFEFTDSVKNLSKELKTRGFFLKTKILFNPFYKNSKHIGFINKSMYFNTSDNKRGENLSEQVYFIPYYSFDEMFNTGSLFLRMESMKKGTIIGQLDTSIRITKPEMRTISFEMGKMKVSSRYKDCKYHFTATRGDEIVFASDTIMQNNGKLKWEIDKINIKSHPEDELNLNIKMNYPETHHKLNIYSKTYSLNKWAKRRKRSVSGKYLKGKIGIRE